MFGLLNLNKPVGLSSAAALGRIKRLVRPAKIGHAGTIDPIASGVLVACIGPATRLVDYIQQMSKSYRATFLLGRSSDSDDIERPVVELPNPPIPTRGEVERAASAFLGRIEQRPPAFSALKIAGRPAYQLARRGCEVSLAPRTVEIHRITVASYDYPAVVLDIDCGSGTYVRALGRDLALSLGTAAVMSALERTAIGRFRVEDACDPTQLTAETLPRQLLSARLAIPEMPTVELNDGEIERAINGIVVPPRKKRQEQARDKNSPPSIVTENSSRSCSCEPTARLAPRLNFRRSGGLALHGDAV